MLGVQPNHGWQLYFLFTLYAGGSDQTLCRLRLEDLSKDEIFGHDALAVVRPNGV